MSGFDSTTDFATSTDISNTAAGPNDKNIVAKNNGKAQKKAPKSAVDKAADAYRRRAPDGVAFSFNVSRAEGKHILKGNPYQQDKNAYCVREDAHGFLTLRDAAVKNAKKWTHRIGYSLAAMAGVGGAIAIAKLGVYALITGALSVTPPGWVAVGVSALAVLIYALASHGIVEKIAGKIAKKTENAWVDKLESATTDLVTNDRQQQKQYVTTMVGGHPLDAGKKLAQMQVNVTMNVNETLAFGNRAKSPSTLASGTENRQAVSHDEIATALNSGLTTMGKAAVHFRNSLQDRLEQHAQNGRLETLNDVQTTVRLFDRAVRTLGGVTKAGGKAAQMKEIAQEAVRVAATAMEQANPMIVGDFNNTNMRGKNSRFVRQANFVDPDQAKFTAARAIENYALAKYFQDRQGGDLGDDQKWGLGGANANTIGQAADEILGDLTLKMEFANEIRNDLASPNTIGYVLGYAPNVVDAGIKDENSSTQFNLSVTDTVDGKK